MKSTLVFSVLGTAALMFLVSTASAAPQYGPPVSAFTFQGHLTDGGVPADGVYDFEFKLYDSDIGGSQVGERVTQEDVTVTGGLFTVQLDFGHVFDGHPLWLEISVRPGASEAEYTVLSPRQELTATPYALYSEQAPWSGLTGMPAGFADGVDDNTTYTAGTGLSLVGLEFRVDTAAMQLRVGGSCAAGNAIRIVNADGSVTCEAIGNGHNHWGQTWTGTGTGLTLSGGSTGLSATGTGTAVYGVGGTYGVYGLSTSGNGVLGMSTNSQGVYGSGMTGVYGTGPTEGVRGESSAGYGVYGSGYVGGVYGYSATYYGISGSSVSGYGVLGESTNNVGIYGRSTNAIGILGDGGTDGVYGTGDAIGVSGQGGTDGVYGYSTTGTGVHGSGPYGVKGYTNYPEGVGVFGEANGAGHWAGKFSGDVWITGGLQVDGTKAAVVDTQDYGTRSLYALESPQNWFEDFGTGQLVNGAAVINIEPIFAETVNLSQDYYVFLTPRGDCPLYVDEQTTTSFSVRATGGQACSVKFQYRIVARRLGFEDLRLAEAKTPASTAPSQNEGGVR